MQVLNSKFIGRAYQKIQIGAGWVSMGLQFIGFLTFVKVWQTTIEFYGLPFAPILVITPAVLIVVEFLIGHFHIKSKVQSEMNSMLNLEANPEVILMLEKMDLIIKNQEDQKK